MSQLFVRNVLYIIIDLEVRKCLASLLPDKVPVRAISVCKNARFQGRILILIKHICGINIFFSFHIV